MTVKQFLKSFGNWRPLAGFAVTAQSAYISNVVHNARKKAEEADSLIAQSEAQAKSLLEGDSGELLVVQELKTKLSASLGRWSESKEMVEHRLSLMKERLNKFNSTPESEDKSEIIQNINYHLDTLKVELTTQMERLDQIKEIIENAKPKNSSVIDLEMLTEWYNKFQNYIQTLSIEQQVFLANIFGLVFIFACTISLIAIFYGDLFIVHLKLETRFPKLATIIQLRRKFKQYYFCFNIIFIVIMLIIMIVLNGFFFYSIKF